MCKKAGFLICLYMIWGFIWQTDEFRAEAYETAVEKNME